MKQDITGCLNSVNEATVLAHQKTLATSIQNLQLLRLKSELPMLDLPYTQADFPQIEALCSRIRRFKHCIILGAGGSSLGGQLLAAFMQTPFTSASPKLYFIDNVDPLTLRSMVNDIVLADTFILSISKSGGTAETLLQTNLVIDALVKKIGKDAPAKQIAIITIPQSNPLRRIAEKYSIPTLAHDPNVGGRFSVLSLVGLIPALLAGADIAQIRSGAASVLDDLFAQAENSNPARGAALQMALMQAGCKINVLMPYADKLRLLGNWYVQTWDESLGKTPLCSKASTAIGSVDQHSQLQLFLEGARDKLITFLHFDKSDHGDAIPAFDESETSLAYMRGKKTGDLIACQQRATIQTLKSKGVAVRELIFGALDEFALGQILMHFMIETILVADLLGVNAYDQPAVEEGKVLAREYMGRL
jgi:glucose-6-phosphate isomerase